MIRIVFSFFLLLTWIPAIPETLTLQQCVEMVLQHNPDLLQSKRSLKQSNITVKESWSNLLPGASANASTSSGGPFFSKSSSSWDWSLGGSVSQTFYRPGLYTGIKQAGIQREAAVFSDQSLKDQIYTQVENLYYQILNSDTLINVYKANIRQADEQIRRMQQMVELGMKRQSDLLKSEVQKGTFESQLVREQESLTTAKRSLNVLMGREPLEPLEIAGIQFEIIHVPDFETAEKTMLANNPSIKRLQAQRSVQGLSLRIAREAYLPSLSGSYSYSRRNVPFSSPVDDDQVSLHLSYSLFEGFQRNYNVQKEKLRLDDAVSELEVAIRESNMELANQYQAMETQNQLIAIHRKNLESARKDLETVTQQYAAGFSSILDLMDAQVSVLQSETSLVSDLFGRKRIESEINRLMGER
jgi:outer membrane protein